jgi:VanZ family protein
LAYLLLRGSFKQFNAVKNRYTIVIPVVVTIFTGIATELLQALLPIGREASIYDSIANFAGCFAGYLIFTLRKNKSGKNAFEN